MKDSIWITGAKGRLGSELYRLIADASTEITTTDTDIDITDIEMVTQYAAMNHPTVIINCAALTEPAQCDADRLRAYRVNALGARNMAVAARQINAKLIHISTDDIFEGTDADTYNEFDTPVPKSIYAKSKYAGEMMVKELVAKHVIIRSSWLYGFEGDNFVKRVISSARGGYPVRLVKDKTGSPTSIKALAEFIKKLISLNEYGVFHAACEGSCTREEFAREILNCCKLDGEIEYKTSGHRPKNAKIENLMMKMTGIHKMPDWQDALYEFLGGKING